MPAPSLWKLIVAADPNGVVGARGGIPWHLPEDFKWFRQCTLGNIVLMGRKTYDGLPKRPLPGRETWVLSSAPERVAPAPSVRAFGTPEAVEQAADEEAAKGSAARSIWVCGGAAIYAQFLPLCAELYLTRVKRPAENGDAYFRFDPAAYAPPETLRDTPDFSILKYTRR